MEPLKKHVRTSTIHRYMLDLAHGITIPKDPPREFWDVELPEAAMTTLLENPHTFDELIVDEAQDLLATRYWDLMDLSLQGGLTKGRCRFFGDFANQEIYETSQMTNLKIINQLYDLETSFTLTNNCRNTPEITSLLNGLSIIKEKYRKTLRPTNGIVPQFVEYGQNTAEGALTEVLDNLTAQGYPPETIMVLSPHNTRSTAAAMSQEPWKSHLKSFKINQKGYVQYSSIYAFKGLESPVVIVTDIPTIKPDPNGKSNKHHALFYTAVTRAIERVIIIVPSYKGFM